MYYNTTDKTLSDAMKAGGEARSKAFHQMIQALFRIKLPRPTVATAQPAHA